MYYQRLLGTCGKHKRPFADTRVQRERIRNIETSGANAILIIPTLRDLCEQLSNRLHAERKADGEAKDEYQLRNVIAGDCQRESTMIGTNYKLCDTS